MECEKNIFLDYDICIMCSWVQYSPDSSMSDWTSSASLNAQIPKALKKGWTWEKAVQPSPTTDQIGSECILWKTKNYYTLLTL